MDNGNTSYRTGRLHFSLDITVAVVTLYVVARHKKRKIPRPSAAAKALDLFIKDNAIGIKEAAAAVGVTHPALLSWLSGVSKPKNELRKAIDVWTGGLVSEASWMTSDEKTALGNVKPFEPKDGKDAA